MKEVWKEMLSGYNGWFVYKIKPIGYIKMFAFVLIGYLFVMIFDVRRIKKIPMNEVLKDIE